MRSGDGVVSHSSLMRAVSCGRVEQTSGGVHAPYPRGAQVRRDCALVAGLSTHPWCTGMQQAPAPETGASTGALVAGALLKVTCSAASHLLRCKSPAPLQVTCSAASHLLRCKLPAPLQVTCSAASHLLRCKSTQLLLRYCGSAYRTPLHTPHPYPRPSRVESCTLLTVALPPPSHQVLSSASTSPPLYPAPLVALDGPFLALGWRSGRSYPCCRS
jgi:hypothetical protein